MTNMNGRSTAHKQQSHSKGLPNGLRVTVVATGLAAVAACAPVPVPIPPPPPPPPPPVEVIPFRPLPPGGAAFVMNIPERTPAGLRQTVNLGLSPDQTVWNFRSGWNVAALNCADAKYTAINQAYTAYVNDHQRALGQVNSRLDAVYRSQASSNRNAIIAREAVETRTYNFFSLPPARDYMCEAALAFSTQALLTPPTDPIAFALTNFPRLEAPFEQFYSDYETYELESAIWDRDYGSRYGPGNVGWETVQSARLAGDPNVPPIPPVAPVLPVTTIDPAPAPLPAQQ